LKPVVEDINKMTYNFGGRPQRKNMYLATAFAKGYGVPGSQQTAHRKAFVLVPFRGWLKPFAYRRSKADNGLQGLF